MAETTTRRRIDNSAMKIANILGPSHVHTSSGSSKQVDVIPTTLDLHSAIIEGNLPMVQSLCDGIRNNNLPLPLRSMLVSALSGSSASMLDYIFSLGARLDFSMDTLPPKIASAPRSTAFFACLVKHGWPLGPRGLALNLHHGPEVVRLIIDSGSRVGFLCLKNAVAHGNVEIAEMLLTRLNPRTKVPDALDYSANLENSERWYGPEMNSEESSVPRLMNQAGFLQIAASEGHVDMVRWLIGKGAQVDSMPRKECCCWDVNGSALSYAAAAGRVEVVRLLLELGADPCMKDEEGRTPMDLNAMLGQQESKGAIEDLLRKRSRGREGG